MIETERKLYEHRIDVFTRRLPTLFYEDEIAIAATCCVFEPPVPFARRLSGAYQPIKKGEIWGKNWQQAWFHLTAQVPEHWRGETVCARINIGGEAIIFSQDGTPVQGLSFHSIWGKDFKRDRYLVCESARGGELLDLWLEASACQLFGLKLQPDPELQNPHRFGHYEACINDLVLAVFRSDTWHLSLDFFVLNNQMKSLPEKSVRRARILLALNNAIDLFKEDRDGVQRARNIVKPELEKTTSASDLATVAIGHAHIDTAWLWPVSETIRKCARTFSSQMALLEKYPNYVFGASQPQHYTFVKEHYPMLYARIKEKVTEGRWEPQGGMWVEADCNIIGGEAMVRQLLIGKNFFKDEFNVDVTNLWLPDVFGYSAAMPQILKKSGIDFMVTQKLCWSQFNQFPHHTFRWRGIDGTEIIVHFPPEDTYNSNLWPSGLMYARENFREKAFLDEFLTLFGIGDGGGGATEEIIETGLRQQNLEECPRVTFGTARDFLDRLLDKNEALNLWVGELYFELHRGTLTTQAYNKKMNRFMEHQLRQLEMLYAALPFEHYPVTDLEAMWKKLLLNQFHDIIPGSSIAIVYQESRKDYQELAQQAEELLQQAGALLLEKKDGYLCLVNTLSYPYTMPIELPESWSGHNIVAETGEAILVQQELGRPVVLVEIPALGSVTLKLADRQPPEPAECTNETLVLENDLVRYEFSKDGTIVTAFDKECNRDIIISGQGGNVLALYEDRPVNWDAWDIDIFYENQLLELAQLQQWQWLSNGPVRQGLKMDFTIGQSNITQKIYLATNRKRLDFVTKVAWHERHKMLRVAFTVDIHSETASFDIQYGYISRNTHRNTSWDLAKFEVAAHRFVDLSEPGYGVALLNNCKYGHKVLDNIMEIALLRATTNPDPEADRGVHTFTYSFLPHKNDLIDSTVFSEAAQLNQPALPFPGYRGNGFRLPVALTNEAIVLEVIKKAEKENATILRLYEPRGCHATTSLKLARPNLQIFETDLMENNAKELVISDNRLELIFRPFEIKTIKCVAKGRELNNLYN